MRGKFVQHIAPLAQPIIANKQVPKFEDYLEANYRGVLEIMAEKAGYLQDVQSKGFEGLLDVPSLNVAVRAQVSITYANTFLGRKPQQGDSADMQQAFVASAVRILITEDIPFQKVLKRANSPYLTLMNLEELLDTLP